MSVHWRHTARASEVLPPVAAQLRAEYPELKLELVWTNRVHDLLRHEADIAVRMAPPRQQSLIARRVGQVELGLHAHQRHLERHGTPRTPADLMLARQFLLSLDTWLTMHEDPRASARCQVTFGALLTGLACYINGVSTGQTHRRARLSDNT